MKSVNCVVLDQDEMLLAKGSFVSRSEREAVIRLSPGRYAASDFPEGRLINIRMFDSVNGLSTYKGAVSRIEDDVLQVANYEVETHTERREDVKVMVNRPVFLISKGGAARSAGATQKFMVMLRDISAGGVGIVTDHDLLFDRVYEVVFDLGKEPDILSISLVRKNVNAQGKYVYGCRFVDMHPSQESQVREYVFKKHLGLIGRN